MWLLLAEDLIDCGLLESAEVVLNDARECYVLNPPATLLFLVRTRTGVSLLCLPPLCTPACSLDGCMS